MGPAGKLAPDVCAVCRYGPAEVRGRRRHSLILRANRIERCACFEDDDHHAEMLMWCWDAGQARQRLELPSCFTTSGRSPPEHNRRDSQSLT